MFSKFSRKTLFSCQVGLHGRIMLRSSYIWKEVLGASSCTCRRSLIFHKSDTFIHTKAKHLTNFFRSVKPRQAPTFFEELARVIGDTSVKTVVRKGFLARNTLIAENCDYLIAFTFSADVPIEGGTFDTWKKTPHSNKINIDLSPCP